MSAVDVLGDALRGARPGRSSAREAAAEARGGLGGVAQAGGGLGGFRDKVQGVPVRPVRGLDRGSGGCGGGEARVRSIAGSI